MELFNKTFYTLNKTPLGETGCLSIFFYLLAAQTSSFLIHPLSQTQSVRAPLVPYYSLFSTCVTYGMLCHVICHQVLPTQPFLGKQRIFLGVASILRVCLCPHS